MSAGYTPQPTSTLSRAQRALHLSLEADLIASYVRKSAFLRPNQHFQVIL